MTPQMAGVSARDIVHSAVLQLHATIEDLLTSLILYCVLNKLAFVCPYRKRNLTSS
jgi:hypothetical protein